MKFAFDIQNTDGEKRAHYNWALVQHPEKKTTHIGEYHIDAEGNTLLVAVSDAVTDPRLATLDAVKEAMESLYPLPYTFYAYQDWVHLDWQPVA